MTTARSRRATGLRTATVTCLAINSGATDAIGFLALGGAFTSVMTGNMVLLGLSLPELDGALGGRIGAAIACYMIGCSVGVAIAGSAPSGEDFWPRSVTRALAVEAALVLVNSVLWWGSGSRPHGGIALLMLSLNAIALGIQSSSVQRLGTSGLSTTYLTGTLTSLVSHVTARRPVRGIATSAILLVAFIGGGAVSGTFVLKVAPLTPIVQLACLGSVVLLGFRVLPSVKAAEWAGGTPEHLLIAIDPPAPSPEAAR